MVCLDETFGNWFQANDNYAYSLFSGQGTLSVCRSVYLVSNSPSPEVDTVN